MKKFLVSLAVLSMTAVLFTACTPAEKTPAVEAEPAATSATVTPDAAATATDPAMAAKTEVKVDATTETK